MVGVVRAPGQAPCGSRFRSTWCSAGRVTRYPEPRVSRLLKSVRGTIGMGLTFAAGVSGGFSIIVVDSPCG